MTTLSLFLRLLGAAGLGWLASAPVAAVQPAGAGGISLNQTRVILTGDSAQTLTVTNSSDSAFLIQSRALHSPDGGAAAPFTLTPPLFTLAPGSSQMLRILPQNAPLPADRESLFYLSVLAIPAGEQPQSDAAQMSMGIRFNLKLFYRPTGLDAPTDAQGCRLRFTQSARMVRINNPTPYYQTLGTLMLDGKAVSLTPRAALLAPGETRHYPAATAARAQWQIVNDYGALAPFCRQVLNVTPETP